MGQASGLCHAQLEAGFVGREVIAHQLAAPTVLAWQAEELAHKLAAATLCELEHHRAQGTVGRRAVAPDAGPVRLAVAWLEHRHRCLVGVQHAAFEHLGPERINQWLQPLKGIGEDAFALNEHFAEDSSILDFETLLDYDRYDHAFQQDAKQRDFEGYQPEPYTGALHGTWARALVGGRLCYLTLTMASWRLYGAMEDAAGAEALARLPHRHVRGPEDGKRDASGSIRWDMRVQANGQEALLGELQHRIFNEQFRRSSELGLLFCEQRLGACFLDDHPWEDQDPDERNLLVVFSAPDALAAVRFTSFLRDCRRIERPLADLRALEAGEAKHMREFVAAQHEDLVKNFDPKVVPLHKKLGVMIHPEALRDMEDDGLL